MQLPVSWLREFVEIDRPPAELARLITNAGLEVEDLRLIGLPGAELVWDRERVRLAQLVRVDPHPDADRLLLATADYGGPAPKVVVTGAPNLFPFVGQGDLTDRQIFSPIIFEGATYRDPYKDGKLTVLKGRPLRGIYNDAMLCSQVELGLGDDHDGVILIEKDAGWDRYAAAIPLQAGLPLQDVLGDAVLTIAILPNIARCTSVLGVAREIAALTDRPLRYPDFSVQQAGPPVDGRVRITAADPALNPRFVALLIEQVDRSRPTPFWMRHRLALVGQRSLGALVDVSNYVMFELGQPNHAFDYDFLRSRADQIDPAAPVQIITRLPQPGETLITLDDAERALPDSAVLVADPVGNLSLGGIMGGRDSEIKDVTTNVLLEAAAWNFINIRKTMTRLKLHTEAGYRFSRGVHPAQAVLGARRAAELLRVVTGGVIAQGEIDHYPAPPAPVVVRLEPDFIRRWTGLELEPTAVAALLRRLEFDVQPDGDALRVTVPDHRLDVEGPHDLAEEVCRLYGYDRIPTTILADTLPPQRGNPTLEAEERIKDRLVQAGLQEAITYRLTTAAWEARLLPDAPADDRPYVTVINPSSAERVVMRHSLLAALLQAAAANSRFQERIALFEIGPVYLVDEDAVLPEERTRLALVLCGRRDLPAWQPTAADGFDFYDLKGIVDDLLQSLGLTVSWEPLRHPSYRPGRAAALRLDGQIVGRAGELHPLVVEQTGLASADDRPTLAAEIDLAALLPRTHAGGSFRPISDYPAVLEDLAFVVPAETPAAAVEQALRKAGGPLLRSVALFDVYSGEHLGPGRKSLAYHLVFQSVTETLQDKVVEKLRRRMIAQVEGSLGAVLRR